MSLYESSGIFFAHSGACLMLYMLVDKVRSIGLYFLDKATARSIRSQVIVRHGKEIANLSKEIEALRRERRFQPIIVPPRYEQK